ncbi:MAG: PepSY-like domain-containing protein [Muribaculaceae bacterium]|nr:PepSY-like domain-containing protein [Muribaculaceae bacterium]MDE6809426.1 PepSY-like domain-containing protein [Muribaculaceae bacterium]
MKTTLRILGIGFIMSIGTMFMAQAQSFYTGVGPAISEGVSKVKLPAAANKYISNYFEGVSIVKADREFMSGSYDVEMADGTELEFNKDGKIIEIDAPDGYALSNRTLGSILPAKAIETLRNLGTDQLVTNVEKTAQGYTAEIAGNDDMEYQFNNRGEIVSISYD